MAVSDNGLYMLNVRQMITMLSSAYVNLIENQIPFSAETHGAGCSGAVGYYRRGGYRALGQNRSCCRLKILLITGDYK